MRTKEEQGGELIVTGHDKVEIHLKDFPHKVDVVFKHKHEPPPCDSHHHHLHDRLEWEVHRNYSHHHAYTLIIKWHVSEVREIMWFAYY